VEKHSAAVFASCKDATEATWWQIETSNKVRGGNDVNIDAADFVY